MNQDLKKEFREAMVDLKSLIEGVRLHISSSSDHLLGRIKSLSERLEDIIRMMDV
jgi:hypothetical protein